MPTAASANHVPSPEVAVLRYWADVEALTPPAVEDDGEEGRYHLVAHLRAGDVLPWDKEVPPEVPPSVHFVQFGLLPRAAFEAELLHWLMVERGEDRDDGRRQEARGLAFLGAFAVGPDGLPAPDTLQVPAFAASFARLRGLPEASVAAWPGAMAARYASASADLAASGGRVDAPFLSAMASIAHELLGWTPSGSDEAPLAAVRSEAVLDERRRPRDPQPPPIEGFYRPSIAAALDAAETGRPNGLVAPYVATPDASARIDCTNLDVVRVALAPSSTPLGRWPSEHPLALMQQVAVNEALQRLANGGIFSVNGPPGTGKTTLLLDVVAALVVERAKVLADYARPRDAFRHRGDVTFPGGGFTGRVYGLDRRLHDFLIVVASSNNGAVENITRELPNAAKLGTAWRERANFFAPTAALLLAPPDEDDATGREPIVAWGLISAALGRKANRIAFRRALTATEDVRNEDGRKIDTRPAPGNLFRLLDEARPTADWGVARRAFNTALIETERLASDAGKAERLTAEIAACTRAASMSRASATAGHPEAVATAEAVALLSARAEDAERALARADRAIDLERELKPNDDEAALSEWRARLEPLVRRRAGAEEALETAQSALDAARQWNADLATLAASAETEAVRAEAAAAERTRILNNLATRHSGLRQWEELVAGGHEALQQTRPFSSPELEAARARLFLAAMDLHKAFVVAAGHPFEANLKRALDMLTDRQMSEALDGHAADLWATLSLVVPVVSTTFASFDRTFGALRPGSIPWLLVDEAGQVAPQHAVGAMRKARRALVIGDPFQVEPVLTLDPAVDRRLRERHGAPLRVEATSTSMQVMADAINPLGTRMGTWDGAEAWVGAPLTVHRRCAEPMFSIANRLAYGGSMVLGAGRSAIELRATEGGGATPPRPLLGPSRWFDLKGADSARRHFIPIQGATALAVVRAYVEHGWVGHRRFPALPDLFLISPFRSVAQGLRDLLWRERRDWAPDATDDDMRGWLGASVGTVHTFQGKEAETVLLVLGGASRGAIEWATATPNVLNVAVTRAQRRLYIIGDHDRWRLHPLARIVADAVPVVSADELSPPPPARRGLQPFRAARR